MYKNKPLFGYKTLFLLKKRSKSTFQPVKVCSKWVCLEGVRANSECFYALLWSRCLLDGFWLLFDHFWAGFRPFWSHKKQVKVPKTKPKWAKNGVIFWVILDHFWMDPRSLWGHLGIILASFGLVLVSFWFHSEAFLGVIFVPFLGHFSRFLAGFYGFFLLRFLVMFWEVDCKTEQIDAREGKNIQNSAKIHQKCKIVQKLALFRL